MTDRLEDIRQRHDKFPGGPSVIADLKWLISEIERLRGEVRWLTSDNRNYKACNDDLDTAIATLRDRIKARQHHIIRMGMERPYCRDCGKYVDENGQCPIAADDDRALAGTEGK